MISDVERAIEAYTAAGGDPDFIIVSRKFLYRVVADAEKQVAQHALKTLKLKGFAATKLELKKLIDSDTPNL